MSDLKNLPIQELEKLKIKLAEHESYFTEQKETVIEMIKQKQNEVV